MTDDVPMTDQEKCPSCGFGNVPHNPMVAFHLTAAVDGWGEAGDVLRLCCGCASTPAAVAVGHVLTDEEALTDD
jgi:hypothetical protein